MHFFGWPGEHCVYRPTASGLCWTVDLSRCLARNPIGNHGSRQRRRSLTLRLNDVCQYAVSLWCRFRRCGVATFELRKLEIPCLLTWWISVGAE